MMEGLRLRVAKSVRAIAHAITREEESLTSCFAWRHHNGSVLSYSNIDCKWEPFHHTG